MTVLNTARLGVNVPLMEAYLRQLHLKTFVRNWEAFAQNAAKSGCSYDGFLMGLAEVEVSHREKNRHLSRIKAALLDRLTHRAHIIEFSGADSFRFKQRLKRLDKSALSGGEPTQPSQS